MFLLGGVLVMALSTTALGGDVCSGATFANRVRCNDDVLTWCEGETTRAVQTCGKNACREPPLANSRVERENGVAAYCAAPLASEFLFSDMAPQTEREWSCAGVDELNKELTPKERADAIKAAWAAPDMPSYVCRSDFVTDIAHNTHDFRFRDVEGDPHDLASSATLVGVEVVILARTNIPPLVKYDGDVVPRCYLHSVQLRSGDDVESDNRGSVDDKVALPEEWTEMVYGGHTDLWDTFQDFNDFKDAVFVEIDGAFAWFNKTTNKEVKKMGSAPIKGTCQVAAAKLRLHHFANGPKTMLRRVVDNGPQGAVWDYFNPRDESGKGDANKAPADDWKAKNLTLRDGWDKGAGPFGYGDEDRVETSHISSRRSFSNFRTTFDWQGRADCVQAIKIEANVDDGLVLYLNGQPIWWLNFDVERDGLPAWDDWTLRPVAVEDKLKVGFSLSRLLLVNGTNYLAAEVHQFHKDSTDLYFDLALKIVESSDCAPQTLAPGTKPPTRADAATTLSSSGGGGAPATTAAANATTTDAAAPDSDGASVVTTVLLGGAVIGLLLFFVYLVWTRMKGKRQAAAARGGSGGGHSFAQYVPEDVQLEAEERGAPTPAAPTKPTIAHTEPELKRSAYPAAAAAPSTGVSVVNTSGIAKIEKKQLAANEWDDF